MKTSGIYRIVNTENGHSYVGSAVDLKQRIFVHKSLLRRGKHGNRHLQNAWRKYGEGAFTFNIALYCDKIHVLFYEQRAMDVYRPEYNLCPIAGNTSGQVFTVESRLKMSMSGKGKHLSEEHKRRIAAAGMGRIPTAETRKKLSESCKRASNHFCGIVLRGEPNPFQGKKHTEETKRKLSERAKNRTAEHRQKLSESLKGRIPWNKGKVGVYSADVLLKMSDAHRAAIASRRAA